MTPEDIDHTLGWMHPDLCTAFIGLVAWIKADAALRSIAHVGKLKGAWEVQLRVADELLTPGSATELKDALRNAVMIATLAGHQ
jgi:hypothetical protein